MMTQQLEIRFDRPVLFAPRARRVRDFDLARWWFARIRQTVAQSVAPRRPSPASPVKGSVLTIDNPGGGSDASLIAIVDCKH